ncbi:DUF2877 domain-containing protein [Enterococcus sp. BWR-S5]|uniref:DUF2877 domain-containing protein n=1 Tax=Enterococcus sp. BWR-S5 TaxID=2787714 RepID=UPI001F214A9B|nr:DUF2877 domain-containing protein [Enterococcus sp. BWR-S5]
MLKSWVFALTTKIRISEGIFPIDRFGKMGSVHSVFQHSFNIKVGGQLINLTNHPDYLSGFGIHLPDALFQEIFPCIQQGNIVKIIDDRLSVYSLLGVCSFSLKEAEVVPLKLSHLRVQQEELCQLEQLLASQQLETAIGLPFDAKTVEIVNLLRSSKTTLSSVEWQEVLNYLIGRGKGLTPSGDDILTAYLAILFMVGNPQAEALSSALANQELSTTDISKAYIISSIHGYVNSLVYQLFLDLQNQENTAVIEQAIERIRAIGHSSGTDLCFGLLLGLQKIRKCMDVTE